MKMRGILVAGLFCFLVGTLNGAEATDKGVAKKNSKPDANAASTNKDAKTVETSKDETCKDNCAAPENCKSVTAGTGGRTDATHKQVRVLAPKHDGQRIDLNTYCLTPDGDLLLCVGGPKLEYRADPEEPGNVKIKRTDGDAFVQRYSPEGELLAEYKVDFKPTAINMIPGSEDFVVAGQGWLVHMSKKGEVVKKSRTPNIGDIETFKKKALEAAEAQVEEFIGQFKEMVEQCEKTIAELEKTPEEKRTNNDKAQIKAQQMIAEQYNQQIKMYKTRFGATDADEAVRDRLTITGIAATKKDLFVSIRKLKGHGYEVWRTDLDFANGEVVLEDLRGCCGQMDIQASSDSLLVAENGKFKVGVYDRDGEPKNSFGKRDRKADDGFGSCCNPMNVRCCENGEILTAESSIGDIKRFSADGKFLGYVGRAKIGGGCKHVAIAFDAKRDRYYMQHQDKNQICVMLPISEVPGPTEDELKEKAAREGLGVKLIGTWGVPGAKKPKKTSLFGRLSTALGGDGVGGQDQQEQYTFEASGALKIVGGPMANFGRQELEWAPVRQEENKLYVTMLMEGVEFYSLVITFQSDNEAKIEMRDDDNVMSAGTFVRHVVEPAVAVDSAVAPVSSK